MICKATQEDLSVLAQLGILMWRDHTVEDLEVEFSTIIKNDNACFFIKYENGIAVGFAQCQLRYDYVEGAKSSPVGYLEGIFVKQECRGKGYAGQLLCECQEWAKERSCTEFASDCELDNRISRDFHLNMGFSEANRIICFIKKL